MNPKCLEVAHNWVVSAVTGMRTLAGTHKLIYIAAFLVHCRSLAFRGTGTAYNVHKRRCFSPQMKPGTEPLLVSS